MNTPQFPIVGVGASAGGLAAFEAFFSGIPKGTLPGMAFVLVQHLDPEHKSLLSELIARVTTLPVIEVAEPTPVVVNTVYVIPPGHDLTLTDGELRLSEPEEPRGRRFAIDVLFRSLALDEGPRAIGIVLSGTGSDGSAGVREIKEAGGLVIAQDPATAEFGGMPQSAIATSTVDKLLAPALMIPWLASHITTTTPESSAADALPGGRAMERIFRLLRTQTGHDFAPYKPGTLQRRIERRMAAHHMVGLDDYVRFIQRTPAEVDALFRDLLIGVTSFFRDPEAFHALESQVIPGLFVGANDAPIRIWSVGCSSGEEPYSIAILLAEHMERTKSSRPVQLFATDLDAGAIARARTGVYPAASVATLSADRIARCFVLEPDRESQRIRKGIRDMVIFSEHDALKDPPFSRLDLIVCRNLLIYLGAEVQAKLMRIFHYALKPGGTLFLGSSEGAGDASERFGELDRKARIYRRVDAAGDPSRALLGRSAVHVPTAPSVVTSSPDSSPKSPLMKIPLRELTEQALLREVPVSGALVNSAGDVLYLHGRTGMFLEPTAGETGIANILKMARDGLRFELTTALRSAVASNEAVRCPGLSVRTNGHFTAFDVTVRPLSSASTPASEPLFVVVIEESRVAVTHDAQAAAPGIESSDAESPHVASLTRELRFTKELLQNTLGDLQLTTENLRSSNEEMQSVNEELQSTNEELETSKEELQSVNEELATVNTELQTKVTDLSRANNDMNNLLAGTSIGTVFVDHQLRILRFTPSISEIINVIPSDIGRPVGHIVANLEGYTRLVEDTQQVLDTLQAKAVDVRSHAGRHYSMRIQPYRTLENVIEGAVISFVDTTEIVETREALRKANDLHRLAVVLRDASDAVTVQQLDGRIIAWNPGAERLYGWTEGEALKMNVRDRIPATDRGTAMAELERLGRSATLESQRTQRLSKRGDVIDVSVVTTALLNDDGKMYAIATTERPYDPRTSQAGAHNDG